MILGFRRERIHVVQFDLIFRHVMFFVSILRLFIEIVTCDFNKLNQFALKFDPEVVLYELLSPLCNWMTQHKFLPLKSHPQ